MNKNRTSGQGMTEFGLLLALVAVVVLLVLAVLSPAVGRLFHTAADSASNKDINNLGSRMTQTVFALTSSSTPTKTPIGWVASSTPLPTNTNTPLPLNTPLPSSTPLATATSAASNTPLPTATPVPAWVFCANENANCTVPSTNLVRYGALSSWNYLTITGTAGCNNTVFAPDPLYGVYKGCYYWSGAWPVTITGVSPVTGTSLGGTTVTIAGSGLMSGATIIKFGTTAATSVVCTSDGSSCTATTPAGSLGAVNVSAAIGGQTAALSNGFTYTVPPPTISNVTPNTGSINGGTAVTITGASFSTTAGATTFTFGGTAATGVSCSSTTTCTATTPAHAAGAVNVVATVSGQTGTLTAGFTFQLIITGISPATGSTYGGDAVTISGVGFVVGATGVSFGGSPAASVSCANTTTCTAVTPVHASGVVDVVVTVGGQTATSTGGFTFITPPPSISNIGPTSGPAAGGTTVTVSGSGFSTTAGATTITFGGTAGTSISCSSSIRCVVTTPAHAAGSVDVVATVGGQSGTLTAGFAYLPSVASVSPSSGSSAGLTSVTVTGTGFGSGAAFTFDGFSATGVSCSSLTTCTMTTPANVAGPADVVVTLGGQTATGSSVYTYNPVITAVSPNTGLATSTTAVTVTGAGFNTANGATTFTFGGTAATSVSCSSQTTCTMNAPVHASGQVNVVVRDTASALTATLTNGFSYYNVCTINPLSLPNLSKGKGYYTVITTDVPGSINATWTVTNTSKTATLGIWSGTVLSGTNPIGTTPPSNPLVSVDNTNGTKTVTTIAATTTAGKYTIYFYADNVSGGAQNGSSGTLTYYRFTCP